MGRRYSSISSINSDGMGWDGGRHRPRVARYKARTSTRIIVEVRTWTDPVVYKIWRHRKPSYEAERGTRGQVRRKAASSAVIQLAPAGAGNVLGATD